MYQCGDLFRIDGQDELFLLTDQRGGLGCLVAVGPGTRMMMAPQKLGAATDRMRHDTVNFLARGQSWTRVAKAVDLAAFLGEKYKIVAG